jgi:hypothetical protein
MISPDRIRSVRIAPAVSVFSRSGSARSFSCSMSGFALLDAHSAHLLDELLGALEREVQSPQQQDRHDEKRRELTEQDRAG